eukprot:scaffold280384_cov18-Tisochrysis_lutea.AAC.1
MFLAPPPFLCHYLQVDPSPTTGARHSIPPFYHSAAAARRSSLLDLKPPSPRTLNIVPTSVEVVSNIPLVLDSCFFGFIGCFAVAGWSHTIALEHHRQCPGWKQCFPLPGSDIEARPVLLAASARFPNVAQESGARSPNPHFSCPHPCVNAALSPHAILQQSSFLHHAIDGAPNEIAATPVIEHPKSSLPLSLYLQTTALMHAPICLPQSDLSMQPSSSPKAHYPSEQQQQKQEHTHPSPPTGPEDQAPKAPAPVRRGSE